jgi:hypothetical protein
MANLLTGEPWTPEGKSSALQEEPSTLARDVVAGLTDETVDVDDDAALYVMSLKAVLGDAAASKIFNFVMDTSQTRLVPLSEEKLKAMWDAGRETLEQVIGIVTDLFGERPSAGDRDIIGDLIVSIAAKRGSLGQSVSPVRAAMWTGLVATTFPTAKQAKILQYAKEGHASFKSVVELIERALARRRERAVSASTKSRAARFERLANTALSVNEENAQLRSEVSELRGMLRARNEDVERLLKMHRTEVPAPPPTAPTAVPPTKFPAKLPILLRSPVPGART